MAWEENSRICLHMQLIAILSRIGVNVTDFPIRDHKVILKIRRRRWKDLRTGKSFSIPIDLDIVAKGTRYSKEFGAFLKETYGDVPGDLPYA